MDKAIQEFKKYLLVEKNSSQHTLDGYLNDIAQFQDFLIHSGHAIESATIQFVVVINLGTR